AAVLDAGRLPAVARRRAPGRPPDPQVPPGEPAVRAGARQRSEPDARAPLQLRTDPGRCGRARRAAPAGPARAARARAGLRPRARAGVRRVRAVLAARPRVLAGAQRDRRRDGGRRAAPAGLLPRVLARRGPPRLARPARHAVTPDRLALLRN